MPLPSGVTLRQIDGGPSYYAGNGFTYAANAGFNGMSWDDPRFFPIGQDYSFYPAHSTATFLGLGLNFSHRVTSDTDLAQLRSAGIWALPAWGEGTDYGAETIGWHIEEPTTWAQIVSAAQAPGSALGGRLLQISNTWNQFVFGGYSGTPSPGTMAAVMSSPISTAIGSVHLNVPGDDIYWFAGSTVTGGGGPPLYGQDLYGTAGLLTADQCARGPHYGDMVDWMRAWMTAYPGPVGAPYIETEDGLVGTGSREITPPELNWAVWSSIIHGARWILYFSTTSNFGSGSTFGFSTSVLGGQSVSMYNQAIATNGLVKTMAPAINSPTAVGYFTVTPPAVILNGSTPDSGIDAVAKYCTNGYLPAGYYIFATTRASETATNISATFTTADRYSGPVTVMGESRTVTAVNGVWTDTFATGAAVHIYQVPAAIAWAPSSGSLARII